MELPKCKICNEPIKDSDSFSTDHNHVRCLLNGLENSRRIADQELDRIYDWLTDENREPANTKFTAGKLRDVAREIEVLINGKHNSTGSEKLRFEI